MKTNIVNVNFMYGKTLPYLNDKLDLKVGDKVYVEGSWSKDIGTVTEIITDFKASLKYYKHVICKVDFDIHGEFRKCDNFYISLGKDALPFEQLLLWVKSPIVDDSDEAEEFIVSGNGYEVKLNEFDFDNTSVAKILNCHEFDCCAKEINVEFITVNDGKGYAVIYNNDELKTVDFDYDGKTKIISHAFCDCICPKLCEDIELVAHAIKTAIDKGVVAEEDRFSIIDEHLFRIATENKDLSILI